MFACGTVDIGRLTPWWVETMRRVDVMTARMVAMRMNVVDVLLEMSYGRSMGCSPSFQPNERTKHTLLPILHPIADSLSATSTALTAMTVALKSDMVVVENDSLCHGNLDRWRIEKAAHITVP
jgi:hypothetical protein